MKLYVKRDKYGELIQSKLVIESMDDLATLRLALDCKIEYCKEWTEIFKHSDQKEFWESELEKYTQAYHAVDIANALEWK